MKKNLFILMLSILMLSPLMAAGKQESVQNINLQIGISTREVGAALPELLDGFQKENPNIAIDWNKVPGVPNDQHTLYVTNMISESNQPDVLALDVIWPGEFIANGWAEPLNDYIDSSQLNAYLDGMMNSVTSEGKIYGIPLYTNAIHFFYRKDLLDKYNLNAPKTWEEMIKQAKMITQKENNPDLNGFISMWAQIEGLFMNYLQFYWAAGGSFFDATGKIDVDNAAGKKALGTMVDMIYKDKVAPESILTYKPNDAMALFRQGRAVFMVVQDFVWPMLNADDSPVKGDVVMDRVPYFEGHSDAKTVAMGGWILTINPFSEHKAEAAKLISYLTSEKSGLVLATKSGAMPARKGMEKNKALLSAYPIAETLYKDFAVGDVRPSAQTGAKYPEVSHIMQMAIHEALLKVKTVDQALSDAQKALEALF